MKDSTIMKSSTILKGALRLIRVKYSIFICHAISEIYSGEPEDKLENERRKNNLIKWIESMIAHSPTVNYWLAQKGIYGDADAMSEYRCAWLEQLIKICEAEGD